MLHKGIEDIPLSNNGGPFMGHTPNRENTYLKHIYFSPLVQS